MKHKSTMPNSKLMTTTFPITVLLHLFFIVLSIYNIFIKDSTIAISLSIFSLIIFTSMLTLTINAYINYKRQNNWIGEII